MLCMGFINLEKAFDSIDISTWFRVMWRISVPDTLKLSALFTVLGGGNTCFSSPVQSYFEPVVIALVVSVVNPVSFCYCCTVIVHGFQRFSVPALLCRCTAYGEVEESKGRGRRKEN